MGCCKICHSFAINHGLHGRDGSDPDLCDVCYWRKRVEAIRVALIECLDDGSTSALPQSYSDQIFRDKVENILNGDKMTESQIEATNRSGIADAFTDAVASRLHHFDRVQTMTLAICTAADITEMTEGAIIRYRTDRIFHAKVTSIVAILMQILNGDKP